MNVDSKTLARMGAIPEELKSLFTEVPEELAPEAEKRLGDKECAQVDYSEDTPLTRWATKKKQQNNKARRKMAKASRRANR